MSRQGWRSDRRVTDVLDNSDVLHLAVDAAGGPHVTPVVFDVDGGRLWFVTPRRSAKVRAIRRRSRVGGLVQLEGRSLMLGGQARAVDPLTVRGVASPGRLLDLPFAAAGYLARNLRHATGTVVDHPSPTLAISRVVISVDVTRMALLEGPEPARTWGRWEDPDRSAGGSAHGSVLTDRPGPGAAPLDVSGVPDRISGLLGDGAAVVLGWPSRRGPVALPGRWRADGSVEVPTGGLGLAGAGPGPERVCVTAQRSRYRLDSKEGLLLAADAWVDHGGGTTVLRLRPLRLSWWTGDERHRLTLTSG